MSDEILKQNTNVHFEWLDTNTLIKNTSGEVVPAGTCLRLNDYIIFLKPLTVEQLEALKSVVEQAVEHELIKRNSPESTI